jgi:hypothetical protein
MATRLDDNFKKRSQENKKNYKSNNFQGKQKQRHPDEID